MSQQFTKPFVQSHYHGYTGADDDYGACEDVTGLHEIGWISAAIPSIRAILKIFEPTTLPTAMPCCDR